MHTGGFGFILKFTTFFVIHLTKLIFLNSNSIKEAMKFYSIPRVLITLFIGNFSYELEVTMAVITVSNMRDTYLTIYIQQKANITIGGK